MSRAGADHYCYSDSEVPINRYDIREIELVEALEEKLIATKMAGAIEKASKQRYLREAPWVAHKELFKSLYKWAGKDRTAELKPEEGHIDAAFSGRSARIIYSQARKLAADGRLKEALIFLALGFEKAQPFRRGTSGALAATFAVLCGTESVPDHQAISTAAQQSLAARDETLIENAVLGYLSHVDCDHGQAR
ncbi:MAG: hypothetical protein AAF692_02255 [Pseudomonadota bacterium]